MSGDPSRHSLWRGALGIVGCLALIAACEPDGGLPDPRTLPYRFQETTRYAGRQAPADLDGDGRDDLWEITQFDTLRQSQMLRTASGAIIEQLNYVADLVKPPHVKNPDGAGPPELLVPIIRNDSMFVTVADATGRKHYSIFLIDGEPRIEPVGILPWDPSVRAFYLLDVDGDGRPAAGVAAAGAAASVLVALSALRRRNRTLETVTRLAVNGRSDGLVLLDQRGSVRWANETAQRCLGPVRHLADLEHRAPELAAFCREGIAAHPPQARSLDRPAPLGEREAVRVAMEPILVKAPGDPHWVVRLAPRDRRATDESQAWIMMAQRVAHSLKNPLTSILLSLQRLQMDYREMAPAVANRLDRYATRIEGRIDELRALTSNFLKFVNLEQPAMRLADLAELVRHFAEGRRRSMPPDIQLDVRAEPDVPLTTLDPEQIEALLDNLVANAINAMPGGGRVTLSVKALRDMQVGGAARGDYAVLEVADTGTGIPEEIKPRLFEAGFTTAEDGWGLGLAIVKKIVADHGGALEVESDVGVGSVFSVLLPVRGAGPSSVSHAHRPEQQEGSVGGASGET